MVNSVSVDYFLVPSRASLAVNTLKASADIFPVSRGLSFLCAALLASLMFVNFSGNVPGLSIPSLYYYFTCSASITL